MPIPTYCNPLSIEDLRSGRFLDCRQTRRDPRSFRDYRSVSDPSVVYADGKWILYPSYALAYVSEDFVHWKHVDIGLPELGYSPAVACFRGKWYLFGGHCGPELYCADSPTGPFTLCGRIRDGKGNPVSPVDGCLLADGDHLYVYWHSSVPAEAGDDVEYVTATLGAELAPDEPWNMITEPVVINRYDPSVEWQRMGENNQNERMGWIEGQWAIKIGERYYLLYSGSGTEYSSYANGVLISDSPLSGFLRQRRHDPLTEKRTGLMRGAGHGCIAKGPKDTLWVFYTCTFCYNHLYERRIGMDPLGIDENGELYCPEVTETPQFAPGVLEHPESGNGADLLPLTFLQRPTASSEAPGRDALYASDDSTLTWWQPAEGDPKPSITFVLGQSTRYSVEALRLIWRDIGMETLDGIDPGPFRYTVEYAADAGRTDWRMLIDESENEHDLCIDYRTFDAVQAYAVRLTVVGAPKGITPGLVSLTAFGRCVHEKKVEIR